MWMTLLFMTWFLFLLINYDGYLSMLTNIDFSHTFFLAVLCRTWDLSSPTKDWTRASCIGGMECQPLDRQGGPQSYFSMATYSFICWMLLIFNFSRFFLDLLCVCVCVCCSFVHLFVLLFASWMRRDLLSLAFPHKRCGWFFCGSQRY